MNNSHTHTQALRDELKQAPGTKMETELGALRSQVASLEEDLHTARTQLLSLRESEGARTTRMKALMGDAGGALAKDLEELLTLKLGKATLEAQAQEARDEAAASRAALEAVNAMHDEHIATIHSAEATKQEALEQQQQALRKEADEVRREPEDKAQQLSAALERAADAAHKMHRLGAG